MELYNNTLITDDLWDFIEANVPNYHERDDVMRQAQLQLLIDGHESPVAGITREEAILLRDNILHGLFAEDVAAFTAKQPVEVPGGISLHDYAETLADIAYECGTRRFRCCSDSSMKITQIVAWANEFSQSHAYTDWAETEYLDKIDEFMQSKLSVFFHTLENPCPVCGAKTMELQYSVHDPEYLSLRCPVCEAFYENGRALAVCSGVEKWEKEMSGEAARKALQFLLKECGRGSVYSTIGFAGLRVGGIYPAEGRFVAFDNRAGACLVEEFRLRTTAVKWMRGEIEIEQRHKYE